MFVLFRHVETTQSAPTEKNEEEGQCVLFGASKASGKLQKKGSQF